MFIASGVTDERTIRNVLKIRQKWRSGEAHLFGRMRSLPMSRNCLINRRYAAGPKAQCRNE